MQRNERVMQYYSLLFVLTMLLLKVYLTKLGYEMEGKVCAVYVSISFLSFNFFVYYFFSLTCFHSFSILAITPVIFFMPIVC